MSDATSGGGRQGREQYVNRRYRVVRPLGAGGMGTVYLVQDTLDDDQLLALKTVRTGVTSSSGSQLAFRNEFRAMTQFRHPNVVEVYEFGSLGPHEEFFTMEVVEGHDLLDATLHATLDRVYDYAMQVGRALEYIHSQGFVHFDLKPDNIMVRRDGTVKVMDFGLVEDFEHLSRGIVKGSVHYLAPEMIRGGPIDHRFDLYSLGAVLFHIVARRPIFDGPVAEVMLHHLHTPPDFAAGVKRPFPSELRQLLERLLEKDPDARLPSASHFLAELGRIAGRPTRPPRSSGPEVLGGQGIGSRFVGREAELLRLRRGFADRAMRAEPGGPSLLLLAGPAGIGRSRLAQELSYHVQLRGVRVARGSSLEDGGQPGLPWSEILRTLVAEILPSPEGVELASFRDASRGGPIYPAGPLASTAAPRGLTATLSPSEVAVVAGQRASPEPAADAAAWPGARDEARARGASGEAAAADGAAPAHHAAAPGDEDRAVAQAPDMAAGAAVDTLETGGHATVLAARARLGLALDDRPERQPRALDSMAEDSFARGRTMRRPPQPPGEGEPAAPDPIDDPLGDPLGDEDPLAAVALEAAPAGSAADLLPLLQSSAAAIARLLPDQEALRALAEGQAPPAAGPGERDWLLGEVVRFLVELSRSRPLMLYLPDLHWADELTVELLERLARALAAREPGERAPRCLLLGCFRDDELGDGALARALGPLTADRVAEVIHLQPMGAPELARMVHSMLGPVTVAPDASRALLERTGGSPFLIEATVRALLERGGLRPGSTTVELADLEEAGAGAPGSLEEVLDRSLDGLPPRELEVLELLSVFNRPVSAVVLQLASPVLDDLPRVLSALEKKRFLQRGWGDGAYHYRMRHNQLRAHLYRGLDPSVRARLHELAGAALEARYGAAERYLEDLAQHFHRGGHHDKSLRYARAAGDQARRLHDARRAAALYALACDSLAALPDHAHRPEEEAELALALAQMSFYVPSLASVDRLTRAADLAVLGGDVDLEQRALHWLGRSYYALGRQREALRCFDGFLAGDTDGADAADLADAATRGPTHAALGRVQLFLGRFEEARDHLGRAAALLRPVAGADEEVSYALGAGGVALALLGDLDEGLARIDESLAIARALRAGSRIALGLVYRGIALCHHGHWEAARSDLDEGLALCARTGDVLGTGVGASFRGQVELAAGTPAEAARLAREGLQTIARAGGTFGFSMLGSQLADALLAAGHVEGALATAADTFRVLALGERWGESALQCTFGRIHAARGDQVLARASFEAAVEVARAQRARPLEAKARLHLGHHLLSTGYPDEGRAELARARDQLAALGMPWYRARAEAALAGRPLGLCP